VLRILEYLPHFLGEESGTGNSLWAWSEALSSIGLDVSVAVDGRLVARPGPSGVRCISVAHVGRGRSYRPLNIVDLVLENDLLVLHGGWILQNIVAGRQALAAGIPFIVTGHGVYNDWVFNRNAVLKRAWSVLFERRHLERSAAVHIFFIEEGIGISRIGPKVPLIVAPNGIPSSMRKWDGGSGGYLLWFGRFDPYVKGLDLLLQAIALIPAMQRPVLRLHGRDQAQGKAFISNMVRDLNLERWVTVGEPIYGREKDDVLTRASGFVYPSRHEASPMAVAEAVGAGVPTLVADYPLGRLLARENAAIKCELTANSLTHGILNLLSENGTKLAKNGATLARGKLSWLAVARSWVRQVTELPIGLSGVHRKPYFEAPDPI
jgi:glycosyltransferase involved in cell wall biosynthesis